MLTRNCNLTTSRFTPEWRQMVRSRAPPEVVSDALRAKFDEMARRQKEEKKIAAQMGGAKVVPESEADVAEEGTRPAPLAGSEAEGDGDGLSRSRGASASLLGEGAGEEKTAEPSAGVAPQQAAGGSVEEPKGTSSNMQGPVGEM